MKIISKLSMSTMILLFICGLFLLIAANLLEMTNIVRAQQRVEFIRLIEKQPNSDRVLKKLYIATMADNCGLQVDKDNLLFKFTLKQWIEKTLGEIDWAIQGPLLEQSKKISLNCPLNSEN